MQSPSIGRLEEYAGENARLGYWNALHQLEEGGYICPGAQREPTRSGIYLGTRYVPSVDFHRMMGILKRRRIVDDAAEKDAVVYELADLVWQFLPMPQREQLERDVSGSKITPPSIMVATAIQIMKRAERQGYLRMEPAEHPYENRSLVHFTPKCYEPLPKGIEKTK